MFGSPVPEGGLIRGRWHGHEYRVIRKLGQGANGHVYLASRNGRRYALKIGHSFHDLQTEINALTAVRRELFVEADDWLRAGGVAPFYVMKYLEGIPLARFLQERSVGWLLVAARGLLEELCRLHRAGFAFCDLKPEHVMILRPGQVELLDYGGVTPLGQAVRQYTEWYDRGYWLNGSRTADEAYDLFAFAILCLQLAGSAKQAQAKPVQPGREGIEAMLARSLLPSEAKNLLKDMIRGRLVSSRQALADWRRMMLAFDGRKPLKPPAFSWLYGGLAASAAMFAITVWMTLQ